MKDTPAPKRILQNSFRLVSESGSLTQRPKQPFKKLIYFPFPFSCIPELRPASTVPIVALVVALIGTMTCLVLVFINYRKTRKVLIKIQRQSREIREANRKMQQQDSQQQQTLLEDVS